MCNLLRLFCPTRQQIFLLELYIIDMPLPLPPYLRSSLFFFSLSTSFTQLDLRGFPAPKQHHNQSHYRVDST